MNKNIKILFTLIGAYIGAGFISGKEINLYFQKYKLNGFFGIIISNLIIAFFLYKVFIISKNNKINNYDLFVEKIIKNKMIKKIMNIYFLLLFCLMNTGLCQLIEDEYIINKKTIFLLIIYFIYLIKNNYKIILEINNYLIPIIFLFIFFSIKFINKNNIFNIEIINDNYFIVSALIYANYNLISLIPITIISAKEIIHEKIFFSIFFLMMTIISIIQFYLVDGIPETLLYYEFPLKLFFNNYEGICSIYSIILILSIFTTMISSAYTFIQSCRWRMGVLVCVAYICLNVSFTSLITFLYPAFGICGFLQCRYIIKHK